MLQSGEVERAIPYLEQAFEARSDDQELLFRLSSGYMMNGRFEEAEQVVQRLLQINAEHQGGKNLLGVLRSN